MSTPGHRMGVGIISAGRVGAVVGSALRAAGHAITGVAAVSDASRQRADDLLPGIPILDAPTILERSELVVLAVPDDALADLAEGLATAGVVPGGQIIAHTSGRYGIEVLKPLQEKGAITLALHPAMTFTGMSLDLKRLIGCPWAVTAAPMFLPIAKALVVEMEGEPVEIGEADRGAYHMALAHGSNHLVVLVNQVLSILDELGVEDPARLVSPLLHAALDETLRTGPAALTGPVMRGDAGTVGEHLDAIREMRRPEVDRTYRALAAGALALTDLDEPKKRTIARLLADTDPATGTDTTEDPE
ncbi:DUF2520 domain-containing protein [Helcobacillus massiliensis]|uniref:Putative short-subunit dehydrogenase-like oxidoreductase (DUF2520 family) n=2 Tax=Helcobacillus massiliensis TaxID=521392 RepID=A0A839R1X3_9MICO|nr:DUF2520 domain-containing protein [Helcobacillus massiliensis]MCG7426410.1 DUF2520 domain-containing protein [Helcobacillus sp. ACRRO]MBB3022656.1 putative short-subunit dehydrogenase-like oxidoreductase (DUF2520 family) [Helcobacillus massiliensis]MCT1558249.1 DUF2520 domain-containing protein [Helcobacillus massiliensis]MCT2035512.1 DUF2520 domain-containing protein [Helcobacillus massiliensis]MCT2331993.1 DUF2520 domain-containing protein [Helcobacillus massiliensis]